MRNIVIVLIAVLSFVTSAFAQTQASELVSNSVFTQVTQKIAIAIKDKEEIYGQVGTLGDADAITMDGKIADFTTVLKATSISQTQNTFHILAGTQAYALRACINETIGNSTSEDKSRTVLMKVDTKGVVLVYVETKLDANFNTITLKRYDAKHPEKSVGYQKGDAEKVFVLLSQAGKQQVRHFAPLNGKATLN